ncbi:unnamed protein product [Pylaiella littoralis]
MAIIIPITSDNIAFSIALGVLLLSVILHPIVRWCFHTIRADVAWKSIEKQEPVEVTKYHFFSEMLGARGEWSTARVVTLMLAAFHVSTWGLELSLDLAIRTDGPVDLLNRPPPVVYRTEVLNPAQNLTDWIVLQNEGPIEEGGSLGNFRGSLVDGNAATSYRVEDGIILGNTVFASWSPDTSGIASGLFYDVDNGQATVLDVGCSTSPTRTSALYVSAEESSKWGDVTECDSGPTLVNATGDSGSPPIILLNSTDGVVHIIVEEESSYPSFLYSVWTPGEILPGRAELNHLFYISSTTRLVEAVVTGVANGVFTGGGCVDLLTKFSVENAEYPMGSAQRVSPFGEHPSSSSVETLDMVEPIVAGVLVSNLGTVCGVMLLVVTGVAFAGCLFCHSRKSLDVYNRDQLIRAISFPNGEGTNGEPAAMKIFVRQEQGNAFSIVISDYGENRGCSGLKQRILGSAGAESAAVEESTRTRGLSRSGSFPVSSRELTFEGVRPALNGDVEVQQQQRRSQPPSRRGSRIVALSASPVPSARAAETSRTATPRSRTATPRGRHVALGLEDFDSSTSSATVGTAAVADDRGSPTGGAPQGKPHRASAAVALFPAPGAE